MSLNQIINGIEVNGHRLVDQDWQGEFVSYNWARAILFAVGCGLRRTENLLLVFENKGRDIFGDLGTCSYVRESDEDECGWKRSLYVDEVSCGQAQGDGNKVEFSLPYLEYMSTSSLFGLVLLKLDPVKHSECDNGGLLGSGSGSRHFQDMVVDRLVEIGYMDRRDSNEEVVLPTAASV